MALVGAWHDHPDELNADLRQYYGLSLVDVREQRVDVAEAASLLAQMPTDCRTFRAVNPDAAMTRADVMALVMEYELRVLIWQRTKDGAKGRNKPKMLPLPSEMVEHDHSAERAFVDAALGIVQGIEDGIDHTQGGDSEWQAAQS